MALSATDRLVLARSLKSDRGEFAEALRRIIDEECCAFIETYSPDVLTRGGNVTRVNNTPQYCGFVLRLGPRGASVEIDIEGIFGQLEPWLYEPVIRKFSALPRHEKGDETLRGSVLAARYIIRNAAPGWGAILEREAIKEALFANEMPLATLYDLSPEAFRAPTTERRRLLNRFVARLGVLGMQPPEIRDHFLKCLQHLPSERTIESAFLLASAKCFHEGVLRDEELATTLRTQFFSRLWMELISEPKKYVTKLYPFGYLAGMGMVDDSNRPFIRNTLKTLMSTGYIHQAFEIVDGIGGAGGLGLFNAGNHPDLGGLMSEADCHDQMVREELSSLAPDAFDLAFNSRRYHDAAALMFTFYERGCRIDAGKWAAVLAGLAEANQPVPMELCTYYVRH